MPKNRGPLGSERLESLARELIEAGALAGSLTVGKGRKPKGLAFLLQDLKASVLKDVLGRTDLTVPLSREGHATLTALIGLRQENERLRELAVTDNLTGLFNVRYFQDRLAVELQRVGRTEKPCSLVLMDLDHFKPVNDTHGHQTGDALLQAVADIMRSTVRAVDVPFRYGGDEMGLILPDTGTQAAFRTAERLRARIEKDARTAQYGVTASLGLATNQHFDREEAHDVVERADQALYQSKHQGGNRVWFFESDRLKEKTTEVTVSERDDLFAALAFPED